jgi:hypothetical protein
MKRWNAVKQGKRRSFTNQKGCGTINYTTAERTPRLNKGAIYGGRVAIYLLRVLLALALCAGVFYFAFNTAQNLGSIYVIATEGAELRADVILGAKDKGELTGYFTEEWLATDPLLNQSPYANFRVTSYNYSFRLESMTAWGWADTGTVIATERVTGLTGTATDGSVDAEGNPLPAPAWTDRRYQITMEKNSQGRWYISAMEVLEIIPKPTPSAGPSASPVPEEPDLPADVPALTPDPVPAPPEG